MPIYMSVLAGCLLDYSEMTMTVTQGQLVYGYGGKDLYEYSVFKPLEGYF